MPTPLDRVLQSKNAILAFGGAIVAATAWTLFQNEPLFPPEPDPTGDPSTWSVVQLKRWLDLRKLHPSPDASREELLERVRLNMAPKP